MVRHSENIPVIKPEPVSEAVEDRRMEIREAAARQEDPGRRPPLNAGQAATRWIFGIVMALMTLAAFFIWLLWPVVIIGWLIFAIIMFASGPFGRR